MVPTNTKQAIAEASLSLKMPAQPVPSGSRSPGDAVLYEGWLLKKRRKKLQGAFSSYCPFYSMRSIDA